MVTEKLNQGTIREFCCNKFNSIINTFKEQPENNRILSKFGEFTENNVYSLLCMMETKMEESGESKSIIKKIYNIVIEGLQNARLHGAKDGKGKQICFIIISKDKKNYFIYMSNIVNTESVDIIRSNLNKIKKMSYNPLKQFYKNILYSGEFSEKGGAKLGFITMALKSDNNLTFDIDKITDNVSLFNMEIKVLVN